MCFNWADRAGIWESAQLYQVKLAPRRAALLARDSNPQPSDPKECEPFDRGSWDAGSFPCDLNDNLCPLSSLCSLCFARFPRNIPGTQDEAARVMDEILTPIPIELKPEI